MKLLLGETLRNRAHQTNKGARVLNGYVDQKNGIPRVAKRPSLVQAFDAINVGAGLGLFTWVTPTTTTLVAVTGTVVTTSPTATVRKLGLTVQPVDWKVQTAISPSVVIAAQDSFGNTVTGYTAAVAVALQNNPAGGTLSGTLSANAASGLATFSNLKLDKVGGDYSVRATSGALRSATSSQFKIVSNLSFTVQPSGGLPNAVFDTPVEVSVVDSASAVITGYTGDITVSIGTNPAAGTLSGTLTVTAVAGVASFTNLQIDTTAAGYTLIASASTGGLVNVTSNTFDIGYSLTISADTSDYNVRTAFQTRYGTPPSTAYTLTVKVTSGIIVSATTTAVTGMTWAGSWPGTPTFNLTNLGYVIAKGGNGGGGAGDFGGIPGDPAGNAMELGGKTVAITNTSGFIWGGGGGGGGGASFAGGGGGGGVRGGVGGEASTAGGSDEGDAGSDATIGGTPTSDAPGTGGLGGEVSGFIGGNGGTGGNWGAVGNDSTVANHGSAGPGGAAGKAINLTGGTATFVSGSGSPNVKGAVS